MTDYTAPPYIQSDGTIVRHWSVATENDKPGSAAHGSTCFVEESNIRYYRGSDDSWVDPSSGGGAHPDLATHEALGLSADGHTHGGGGGEAFPVGSVFIAVVSDDPATLLGYGTWSAFGAGRVLVGLDSGDADFDTAEETGGAKTVTLTTNEMPAHTHVENQNSATTGALAGWGARDTSTATSVATGYSTASTGGGAAHSNIQPFIVVFMWKRTA